MPLLFPPTALFPHERTEEDTDVESARTVSETDQTFLERSLLAAAADQNSRESGSSPPETLQIEELPRQRDNRYPATPQMATPALFVSWQEIAQQLGIPVEHEAPVEDLRTMFQTAIGILPTEHQRRFHELQGQAFDRIPRGRIPVETVAPIVLASMYETHPWVPFGESILWHMAQSYQFWLATPESPPPSRIQINCGGLGGGSLDSPTTPTFHCTHPRVNGTCVYGPSLAPADRYSGQVTEVAAGHTSSLHELATLMSYTKDPYKSWETLGYGRAATLYRRAQGGAGGLQATTSPSPGASCCLLKWTMVETPLVSACANPHVPAISVAHWE